jgi:osmotically-inducible protein OsmY
LLPEGIMKIRTTAVLAAAAVILALACRPNESLEGQAKDAKIATQVKTRLASEVGASTITAVSVNVTNGVVTLAGPVHSAQESSRIESVARGVPGVTDVKNALQVLAPDVSVTPSGSAAPPSPKSGG